MPDVKVTDDWPAHALDASAVMTMLDSSPDGLCAAERSSRLHRYGPNRMPGRQAEPWWQELLEAFAEPLQLLLIAVALLSALFGDFADAVAVGGLVMLVAIIETTTEVRAGRAIRALREMTAPDASVRVDGQTVSIAAADVVPGDILVLEAGDIVAADARVVAARGLKADESTLTGEAVAAAKGSGAVAADAALGERASMLFAGSAVVAGEGSAVVVRTAARTELGRMGLLVEASREPATPLQRAMAQLAHSALVVAIAASVVVPLVGISTGHRWQEMILTGLTVAFATVPEELPILVTVLLAVGGHQLARRGALLRRLRAGETIGSVTTVVTDKTGTLTQNRLRLERIEGDRAAVLTIGLHTQSPHVRTAEPIEAEMYRQATEAGIAVLGYERFAFPFDPSRRLVSRAWAEPDGRLWMAVAGAPEAVISRCDLDPTTRAAASAQADAMARDGLRVIAYARRALHDTSAPDSQLETGLELAGLAGFRDPLREGVRDAVHALTVAGVGTIVISGDHPETVAAVAAQVGLPVSVLTGPEFDALDDDEATRRLSHGVVIARAEPATKHRAVRLLQAQGQIVAVTGDGANDAPALAAADVGIALGSGSQLAREAAGIVLTDDAYSTVVAAVAKGRNITTQLRRAVAFYLGAKVALVLVMLGCLAAGWPTPFQPKHIILLELFMDLGASVAFVSEPSAPQAMHRPPRRPGAGLLDLPFLRDLSTVALTLAAATGTAFTRLGPATDPEASRSAAVLAWLAAHALIAWTLRTRPSLSWRRTPAFPVWAMAALAAGLLLVGTPLGAAFGLAMLDPAELATPLACAGLAALAALAIRLLWPDGTAEPLPSKA